VCGIKCRACEETAEAVRQTGGGIGIQYSAQRGRFMAQRKGYFMEERRKNKRTSMTSKLVIKRVDGGIEQNREISIEIVDVSRAGAGFTCEELLLTGEVYEVYLTIWTKEVIHTFLRIVRMELQAEGYGYGAVFVGLPEAEAARIEVYQTVSGDEE